MSAAFFDAIAERYDRVYALSGATSKERLARVLRILPPSARVLDLGVGTGRELPALLDAGHEVTGVDFSAHMIALCNRRARTIPIVQADFWSPLPLAANAFDAVIALHGALAHPPDENAVGRLLVEVHRVLVSGGIFVAEVPSPEWANGLATYTHRDPIANAEIVARLFASDFWQHALDTRFQARIDSTDPHEHFIVAVARPSVSP